MLTGPLIDAWVGTTDWPGLGMTDTQAQSQFSMWAMVAAPLVLGSDPRSLSSTSLSMLENPRVLAIDQDLLGVQGYLLGRPSETLPDSTALEELGPLAQIS